MILLRLKIKILNGHLHSQLVVDLVVITIRYVVFFNIQCIKLL